MTHPCAVVVGHETRIGRCANGHERDVVVDLYWNPWGDPTGYYPGSPCSECPETIYALSRMECDQRARHPNERTPR